MPKVWKQLCQSVCSFDERLAEGSDIAKVSFVSLPIAIRKKFCVAAGANEYKSG